MKRHPFLIGGLLGGLTALVLAVFSELISYLLGLPGVAFSLFDWMTRHLPGKLIDFFIGTMVNTIGALKLGPTALIAKRIEQGMAVVAFIVIGVVFGLVLVRATRNRPSQAASYGAWGGLILFVPFFLILISLSPKAGGYVIGAAWWAILLVSWGWVLGRLIQYLIMPAETETFDPARRKFLYLVGAGSFTVLVSAVGISLISENQGIPTTGKSSVTPTPEKLPNLADTSGPAQSPPTSALAARFPPVPGTRAELTANPDFYRIDINTIPPSVDGSNWRLDIKGLVNKPLKLTLDEIRSRPAISQAITLECISNEVGGDLISTAVWTGTRLKDIMAEAGMKAGAQEIYITSADGYYESVPMSDVMDDRTLLVYEMNGQPLSIDHGYPLRLYIPNRFGMKQPKWIVSMEVINHQATGYWVDRGWDNQAIPPTTSVIDVIDTDAYDAKTGVLPVGGIAFAGARGISKVVVEVDDGPWETAELRTPALSPLTWVQWRYNWKAQMGQHTFQVRAFDGTGEIQAAASVPPGPFGATGINSKSQYIAQGAKQS